MQRSDFLKLARFFEIFDFLKKMLKGSEASISNLNEQLASFLRFFEILRFLLTDVGMGEVGRLTYLRLKALKRTFQ